MLRPLVVLALAGSLGLGSLGASASSPPPVDHGGEDPGPGTGEPAPEVDASNEDGSVAVRIEVAGSTVEGAPFATSSVAWVAPRCWHASGWTGYDYYEYWKDGGPARSQRTLDDYAAQGLLNPDFADYATATEGAWWEPTCRSDVPVEELLEYRRDHFFGAGKVGQVPVFDRDSLQKFVVLASSTDEGMVALRSGLDAYAAAKYGLTVEALAAATADTHAVALENFQTAYRSQATLEGLFVNAVGKSAIKGAGDTDEIRTAWIGLGGDLVGLIPFGDLVTKAGGGKLAETVISFAIDQASDQIKDGVTESWASLKDKERAVRTEQADIAMQRARYQVLQVMQEHGLMPDYTNVPWASDGQLPTWSEYTNLTPSNQMSAVGDVMDVENGAGLSFDGIDFGEAYNSGFFEYYPK